MIKGKKFLFDTAANWKWMKNR